MTTHVEIGGQRMKPHCSRIVPYLATIVVAALPLAAQETPDERQDKAAKATSASRTNTLAATEMKLDSKWLGALGWRSIGPAGMGGRIVDLAVVESDPSTYWVATAGGGLLKT